LQVRKAKKMCKVGGGRGDEARYRPLSKKGGGPDQRLRAQLKKKPKIFEGRGGKTLGNQLSKPG